MCPTSAAYGSWWLGGASRGAGSHGNAARSAGSRLLGSWCRAAVPDRQQKGTNKSLCPARGKDKLGLRLLMPCLPLFFFPFLLGKWHRSCRVCLGKSMVSPDFGLGYGELGCFMLLLAKRNPKVCGCTRAWLLFSQNNWEITLVPFMAVPRKFPLLAAVEGGIASSCWTSELNRYFLHNLLFYLFGNVRCLHCSRRPLLQRLSAGGWWQGAVIPPSLPPAGKLSPGTGEGLAFSWPPKGRNKSDTLQEGHG